MCCVDSPVVPRVPACSGMTKKRVTFADAPQKSKYQLQKESDPDLLKNRAAAARAARLALKMRAEEHKSAEERAEQKLRVMAVSAALQ